MNAGIVLIPVFGMIIFTIVAIYLKYVVYGGNSLVAYAIKWIPALLLCCQVLYFVGYHKTHNHYNEYIYSIFLVTALIFCVVGDILMIPNNDLTFMIGMLSFLVSYLLIGISKIYNAAYYYDSSYNITLSTMVIYVTIFQVCYDMFIIFEAYFNQKFNTITMIIAIIVYSTIINFAIICSYVYLLNYYTVSAWFTFMGVIIFGASDCVLILNEIKYNSKNLQSISLCLYWTGITLLGISAY